MASFLTLIMCCNLSSRALFLAAMAVRNRSAFCLLCSAAALDSIALIADGSGIAEML